MDDLFFREQKTLDDAEKYLQELRGRKNCDKDEYRKLVTEYSRILRQLRRITKISDKTAENLNLCNLDLLDKIRFDALTGVYSRRYLEENIGRIAMIATGSDTMLSILIIDVDFFKKYNDTYGHSKGDDCLRRIAATLKSSLYRKDDFIARYGGEEFVAVLPRTDGTGACKTADRLLEGIRACKIPHEKNIPHGIVTVSIGIASAIPSASLSSAELIRRADKALYMSKLSGRNTSTFLEPCEREELEAAEVANALV